MPHGFMPPQFDLLLWGATLVDLLIAAVALLLLGRARHTKPGKPGGITLPRAMMAMAITAVGFYLKWRLLRRLGFNVFGLVHLIYLDLAIVVPLLGLFLLVWHRRSRRHPNRTGGMRLSRPVLGLAAITLFIPPVAGWTTFVEPWCLMVNQTVIPVSSLSAGGGSITIGILADLQTNESSTYEANAMARLMDLAPDLILITGDTFQGTDAEFHEAGESLRTLLATLRAPGGVFLVTGNTDETKQIAELIDGTSIRWLRNEIVHTSVNGHPVTIGGIDFDRSINDADDLIARLEAESGENDLCLFMAHLPDVIRRLPKDSRIDLTVTGHTHGGQIVVPGLGPLVTATSVPRRVAAGGLHEMNGNRLFISRGVGHERGQAPRVRFNCRPEIALLIIEPDQSN